jgi:hypothetical protein
VKRIHSAIFYPSFTSGNYPVDLFIAILLEIIFLLNLVKQSACWKQFINICLSMKIIDLAPEHENLYFCCLEDWSDEIKEAGDHKACWYRKMKDRGLRVKLARDDNGVICGMIQYVPSEVSFIEGNDLYVVLCIWIHGHKQGIGNQQKKGMGKALLSAAE